MQNIFCFITARRMRFCPPLWTGLKECVSALDFAVRTPMRFTNKPGGRGLDLGCAVGRSAFEMSRSCKEVVGMDYSHAFIKAASQLAAGENVSYSRQDEGSCKTPLVAGLPEGVNPTKVSFFQGDAMDLPKTIGTFDRVHAANLLCRLSDPIKLLKRLPDLVNTDGELVLATPCTWLEEFTPVEKWPSDSTLVWLKQFLNDHFRSGL